MKRYRIAALGLAALFLYACASTQASKPVAGAPSPARLAHGIARVDPRPAAAGPAETSPAPPAPRGPETAPSLAAALYSRPGDLPGWAREDHVAALTAYQEGCALAHEVAAQETCNAARLRGQADEDTARRFLESSFRVETLGGPGLLTAYFSPQYEAREAPGGDFTAAVRPTPSDLKQGQTYADRTTIEDRPPNGALAWMRPEDLFFLQIQGSGRIRFDDGSAM
ncbi:MAG: MltA domain-containing protein, partial [Alphaproteobacteria bacterium]